MTPVPAALLLSTADRERVAEVRRLAAVGAQSIEALVAVLDDGSWAVRREVSAALASLGDAAVPALGEVLRTRRGLEARIAACVEALVASTGNPQPTLLELARSSLPAVACDAVHVLGRRQAVEALDTLSALVEDVDDNVSLSAIEALGRIGGQQAVEPLIRVLESGNFFRAFPAIESVGRLGDVRATAPLVKLCGNPLYALEAARALGRIGDLRAIPALAALLLDPSDPVVRSAAVALWAIHRQRLEGLPATDSTRGRWPPAQPELTTRRLIQVCPGGSHPEQVAVCQVLVWVATGEAIAALLGFLKIEGGIADAAKAALAQLGQSIDSELLLSLRTGDSARRALLLPLVGRSPARPEVESCLADADPQVRAAACAALARLGDTGAVSRLFALIKDRSAQVSQAAVNAIISLGSNETERLALRAATSTDSTERRAGVRIIATLGYLTGLAVLLAAIDDDDERLRDIALPGLALIDGPEALDALLAATDHPSLRTRTAAVRALGQARDDPRVERALRLALTHPEPWVRYQACHSLGVRKDLGSIDALVVCLEDPAGQVRIAAVEALSHLPGEVAIQVLRKAATAADPDLRRAALAGLGIRGDADVLPTLLEAATSSEPATRLVALSALGRFKQPVALEALAFAANDPDEGVRTAALGVLAMMPGEAATRALVGLIAGRHSRDAALQALVHPTEGRVPGLLRALEHADAVLAGPIASSLGRIAQVDATAGLLASLGSPNVAARRAAAAVLKIAPTSDSKAALAEAALNDPDSEVRRLAAEIVEG